MPVGFLAHTGIVPWISMALAYPGFPVIDSARERALRRLRARRSLQLEVVQRSTRDESLSALYWPPKLLLN